MFTFNPLAKHFAPGTLNWFQLMLSSVILLFSAEKKPNTYTCRTNPSFID